jgi:hypothetical protein
MQQTIYYHTHSSCMHSLLQHLKLSYWVLHLLVPARKSTRRACQLAKALVKEKGKKLNRKAAYDGPVHLVYNPSYSACLTNTVALSSYLTKNFNLGLIRLNRFVS